MNQLTGFRTIIVALVGGVLSPYITMRLGVTLSADEQAQLVSGVMALLMIAMRFATTTPVGGAPKPVLLTAENVLKHIDIPLLTKLILHEVAQRKKAQEPKP